MRRATCLLLAFACTFIFGCAGVDGNFCRVRDLVVQSIGTREVVTEFQIGLGPGLLWLGGTAARLASGEDEAAGLLLDIHAVQVGVYRLRGEVTDAGRTPAALVRRLAKRGYEPIVKVCDKGEATLVFARMRKERLQALLVVAIDGEELVLAEVRGRLERVVQEAVRNRGLRTKKAIAVVSNRGTS
ncbi:MAG: DUF4252 domain-containing protein [candidate division KSB1 bacterium]|nr:DUF4252 domain-containing protein [candidate division KSB1 bacterium]